MKILRLIVLSTLLLCVGLGSGCQRQVAFGETQPAPIEEAGQTKATSTDETVWEMLAQVDRARILDDLRRLTGEAPICANGGCYTLTNRLTGSEGLRRATDYIYSELVGLGYSVEFQNWSRSGYADRNIIVHKTGVNAPTEEIYLVAHVDGVGTDTERFPAADDDASGAIAILELARIFSHYSFGRTVVLLFTTGEEQGTLGAQSFLAQLTRDELRSIKYAIDIDMVGCDADRDRVMELWHGDHLPSRALAQMMSDTIRAYHLDLAPRLIVGCG